MKTPMTPVEKRRPRLLVLALGVALCMPAAACNLDGGTGPGHAAFGGWGQLMANRQAIQLPASPGNRDSGDSILSGNRYSEENDTEDYEPLFSTLPGPAVEVRERGGSIHVEELRDEEPINLRIIH